MVSLGSITTMRGKSGVVGVMYFLYSVGVYRCVYTVFVYCQCILKTYLEVVTCAVKVQTQTRILAQL